jgi:hypothetical protein
MFALRLSEVTAERIARIHQANLNKNLPMKLSEGSLLLWGCDWVEPGRLGGMWLLVTQSRQDAARILATKGLAKCKAVSADPTFALWLYKRTAQSIASAHGFRMHKDQSVTIGEHTNLLWAFDWIQEASLSGSWLLLTQSRREASHILAVSNGEGDTKALADDATITPSADSPSLAIRVSFSPEPFTFRPVQHLQQIWNVPDRKLCGVYLWCIEYHGCYLVNYVGKTADQRGFEGRLWDELRFWRDGCKWKPVDLEAFKVGRRTLLRVAPPNGLQRELEELEPLYRILLASLARAADCPRVENEIVFRLHADEATSQFLCNDKPERYPHDPAVEIIAAEEPKIIGLTVPIPQSLRQAGGESKQRCN